MTIARMPLAALLLGGVGCATLQPVTNPAQFFATPAPRVAFVTYTTGAMVPVDKVRVAGDSLFGTLKGFSHPVAVPLNRVQLIEAVQPDRKRTTLLVAGLAVAGASAVWALSQSGVGEPCDNTYYRATCRN